MKITEGGWRLSWNLPIGVLGLGVGLVLAAVALPWISLVLDRRTRAAQAQWVDFEAFHRKDPARSEAAGVALGSDLERRVKVCQQIQRLDLLQRLEWNSYDWRLARTGVASNSALRVALVAADDNSITRLSHGEAVPGEHFNLMWPRMPVYGRALRELRRQGVLAVGFDVLFQELFTEEDRLESDEQFSNELKRSGAPAILAIAPKTEPASLFQYRAAGMGDVFSTKDADSVARRVRAYTDFRQENPRLAELAMVNKIGLIVAPDWQSILVRTNRRDPGKKVAVDENGCVSLPRNRFVRELVPIQSTNRVWHLGLILAAYSLGVDLKKSGIDGQTLWLRSTNGTVVRSMAVDADGYFPINWNINIVNSLLAKLRAEQDAKRRRGESPEDSKQEAAFGNGAEGEDPLVICKIEDLMKLDWSRTNGVAVETNLNLAGRVAVIGSTASANNLADQGPTSLSGMDFLVGTHLNVANQILEQQQISLPDFGWVVLLMIVLATTSCVLAWKLKSGWLLVVLGLGVAWVGIALLAFDTFRLMLPIVHPLVGGLLLPYGAMVSARAIYEQRERQRVRSVFAKMVSPDIVHEILGSGRVELGGARRELSVLFADVRGFTALTDRYQVEAEQAVSDLRLTGAAAEAHYEACAHEVLETVNLYLGAIADVVKFHQGTLDKYIGDCVMAFWGAPVANPRHAAQCVVAAIDAQRVVARINFVRTQENERREAGNPGRLKAGLKPRRLLPVLSLGTGVNSGIVTVGLMGSDAHIMNYTVFGREVNLASRLEGVSGYARIVIGEATFAGLQQHAPNLIPLCRPLEPVAVKGFRAPVNIYEVLWLEAERFTADGVVWYQATPSPAFTADSEGAPNGPFPRVSQLRD